MFGDQAAFGKGGGEHGRIGGEADIGVERIDHAEPGTGTVDGADDRFGHGGKPAVLHAEIGAGIGIEIGWPGGGAGRGAVALDGLQHVHVSPGAKAAAGAGQHDHAHRIIVAGSAHGGLHIAGHLAAPGVEPVRAVQGDDGNTIGNTVENVFIDHGFGSAPCCCVV